MRPTSQLALYSLYFPETFRLEQIAASALPAGSKLDRGQKHARMEDDVHDIRADPSTSQIECTFPKAVDVHQLTVDESPALSGRVVLPDPSGFDSLPLPRASSATSYSAHNLGRRLSRGLYIVADGLDSPSQGDAAYQGQVHAALENADTDIATFKFEHSTFPITFSSN